MRQRLQKPRRFIDAEFQRLEEHQDSNKQLGNHSYFFNGPNKMQETSNPTTAPLQKNIEQQNRELENSFQISFQASFMKEHEMCMKKQAENLMESYLKQKEYASLGFEAMKILDYFNFQPKILTPSQYFQFQIEIQNKSKFNQFLQFMRNNYSTEVASQLLFVSYWAWKSYLKINDPFISEDQLIESAEKYAKTDSKILFKSQGLKFLNLQIADKSQLNSEEEMMNGFSEFITFFYTTIFLIIEGYFQNPYYKDPSKAKRNRTEVQFSNQTEQDSWGEEINYYPTKKMYYL